MCNGQRKTALEGEHFVRLHSESIDRPLPAARNEQLQPQQQLLAVLQASEIEPADRSDALQSVAQAVAMDSQRLGTGLGVPVMGAPGLQGSGQRTLRIVVEQPLQGRQQLPHLPTVALAEQQAGEAVSVQITTRRPGNRLRA